LSAIFLVKMSVVQHQIKIWVMIKVQPSNG